MLIGQRKVSTLSFELTADAIPRVYTHEPLSTLSTAALAGAANPITQTGMSSADAPDHVPLSMQPLGVNGGISMKASLDRPQFNKFGQHEPATIRIRNIINQYIGDAEGCQLEELVKELLQNADDAKASEVHFVLDRRQLGTSSVWPEWEPLQGPALCIINDSIFTEKDIASIQKLGVGSKGSDPDKTGQFGIGFNVVYQLTDCPTLLSNGVDVCMFDPHLRYVPGACDERPGGHIDLSQDATFAMKYADFMAGFLGDIVTHTGCTIFRLPLRSPDAESVVCNMGFADSDIDMLEDALQSVDFRIFLHSALLFTKTVSSVRVSIIRPTGATTADFEERLCVNRHIVPNQSGCSADDLLAAHRSVARDMYEVMRGNVGPAYVHRASMTYVLRTWDEYVQNEWLITQNFGFHGDLCEDDLLFLSDFFCEDSKKFLPIAGVAAKLRPSSELSPALAYSFLPLPVCTGLPVHVNGHFAIHSSRRAIWQQTAYGCWNRLLRDRILVPAYCAFLLDATRRTSGVELRHWFKYFPDVSKAADDFFKDLALQLLDRVVLDDLAVIPVDRRSASGSGAATKDAEAPDSSFAPPSMVLFACAPRNAVVEGVLIALEQHICSATELAVRFKLAGRKLRYLKPSTALACLKSVAPLLDLPRPVADTCFGTASTVALTLHYVLEGKAVMPRGYELLEGCPLCLTSDGLLRTFSIAEPVFLSHEFHRLIRDRADLFLQPALVTAFCADEAKAGSPVIALSVGSVVKLVDCRSPITQTVDWLQLLWKLVKQTCAKSDAVTDLAPLSEFAILPVNDGRMVKLSDGQRCVLSVEETSRQLRKVIAQMKLPLFEPARACSEAVTEKDVSQYCSPFVLNAVLPEALLEMLTLTNTRCSAFAPEDCETLLQYFSLDVAVVTRNEAHGAALRSLPIFEDVDGVYRTLECSTCIVMDSCIPTHNLSTWMELSDCTLLKEKSAYAALYQSLGLVKKNAVEVYLDGIFPRFSEFDKDLRMMHLTALRTHIVPMLETYTSEEVQCKFWASLHQLAFIPHDGTLLRAENFFDPDVAVLTLVAGLHKLEAPLSGKEWRQMLIKAGLRTSASTEELLASAASLAELPLSLPEDPTAHHDAQVLLTALLTSNADQASLGKLATIRFIPPEPVPVDDDLLARCPPVVQAGQRISLQGSFVGEGSRGRQRFSSSVLAWTVVHVLPTWLQLPEQLKQILQVKDFPSVADVVQHCANLCQGVGDAADPAILKSFRRVVSYIFDFLSTSCDCEKRKCSDCAALQNLRDCTCIDVRASGRRLVRPDQLVVRVPSDVDLDLLSPHVFARPPELSKYDALLVRVGAHASPTPDVYAHVLRSIWMNFGSRPLHVNDKQAASMAVYGLFVCLLQPNAARLNTRPLYLPSDKAVMSLSTELIADDGDATGRAVKSGIGSKSYDFLCSLSGCGLTRGTRELLACLPSDVRPQMLSDIVQECIVVGATCSLGLTCPLYCTYSERLRSKKFAEAMWLLARVPEQLRDGLFNDLGRLKIVEVTCAEQLVAHLTERGRTMENTERNKRVHVENTIGSARLFISHTDDFPGDAGFINEVATAVKAIVCYNEKYFFDVGAIAKLLQCSSDAQVEEFLVDEGLRAREDDMSRPKLGTVVPPSLRHCYAYDPDVRFLPKEYVGYVKPKRNAPSEPAADDSDDVMIYARIIRESQKTEGDDMQGMFREYDIDIGQGYPCVAQSLDLYREARWKQLGGELDDGSGLMLVVSTAGNTGDSCAGDRLLNSRRQDALAQEAKRTVTRLIEEVFADPRRWREREKLRRRLLLKWHPDKVTTSAGSGDTELATEVFKHLQKEFKRLEDAYRLPEDSDSDGDGGTGGVFDWRKRAAKSKGEAAAAPGSEQQPAAAGTADSEQPATNGDPSASAKAQAKAAATPVAGDSAGCSLWLRQATRDLACATALQEAGSHPEWVCAVCCEVVRKVMVAAVLSSEPAKLTSDLSSTRLLGRLHDVAVGRLSRPVPTQLLADLRELHRLGVDDTTTRQPGVLTSSPAPAAGTTVAERRPLAPCDIFTPQVATQVFTITNRLFAYMKEYSNGDNGSSSSSDCSGEGIGGAATTIAGTASSVAAAGGTGNAAADADTGSAVAGSSVSQ